MRPSSNNQRTVVNNNHIQNKVVIVTGGSGTIGKAIAKSFLTNGAKVVITGRNLARLQTAREDILKDSNDATATTTIDNNLMVISGDVTEEKSVKLIFDETFRHYGSVNILVNNAGISTSGSIDTLTSNDFDKVMRVNVLGPFLCSREFIKCVKNSSSSSSSSSNDNESTNDINGGRIINICSISSISPRPDSIPYTTSKFALTGLTKSLSIDARKYNIAVGQINPGNVISDMLSPEDVKQRGEMEGFLDSASVAQSVLTMANLPYSENVLEMTVIPTRQPLIGRG